MVYSPRKVITHNTRHLCHFVINFHESRSKTKVEFNIKTIKIWKGQIIPFVNYTRLDQTSCQMFTYSNAFIILKVEDISFRTLYVFTEQKSRSERLIFQKILLKLSNFNERILNENEPFIIAVLYAIKKKVFSFSLGKHTQFSIIWFYLSRWVYGRPHNPINYISLVTFPFLFYFYFWFSHSASLNSYKR